MSTVAALAAELNISYRQMDYWIRTGLVPDIEETPGSGRRRTLTRSATQCLRVMSLLVRQGLQPAEASHIAQILSSTGTAAIYDTSGSEGLGIYFIWNHVDAVPGHPESADARAHRTT